VNLFGLQNSFTRKLTRHTVGTAGKLSLEDGSRVAVVGGGPAGSFFSYFLLRLTRNMGMDVHVDIFEPRYFTHKGPGGCNHCGGIVSESLVQLLAAEGINLPPAVVQKAIDSYTVHMDVGSVEITAPSHEKRIAAVYRGNGPRDSAAIEFFGFDRYLQDLAVNQGTGVIRKMVIGIEVNTKLPRVVCADGHAENYELVVLATGINSNLGHSIEGLPGGFRSPVAAKTFICEFYLGADLIEQYLGSSMHVFLLDLPKLKFAALIPKGDFVTLCMLGEQIDVNLVQAFLSAPQVTDCFPEGSLPQTVCHCFPRINVRAAVQPFADRFVMVGDCGVSRLYKDGIGSAYRTAKAAANTAVFEGIAAEDFRRDYWPACRSIDIDNQIGKFVFAISRLIQKSRIYRRGILRMTIREQEKTGGIRHMSAILWDIFTGSAPYREVVLRSLHPAFIAGLCWSLIAGNWLIGKNARAARKPHGR
jgi:flavin-dependent dehydrogenase